MLGLAVLAVAALGAYLAPKVGTPLGAATLARARMDVGKTESNARARVLGMLGRYGIGEIDNWCAAAVGTWMHEAADRLGEKAPIAGSAGALATGAQLAAAKAWIDASAMRAHPGLLAPGMIVVWRRGPPQDGRGHVGVVSSRARRGRFTSVEGNAGPTGGAVVEGTHDLSSDNLVGFGWLS